MLATPATMIGLSLLIVAWAFVPDKYRPQWMLRVSWWKMLIGLMATIGALLIVMNPELLALGILGDSTLFDLLVLAVGIQLQVVLSRMGARALMEGKTALRFIHRRYCLNCAVLAVAVCEIVASIQRVAHRFNS